jgi:branched-chain amino acid aminotransferase
MLSGMDEATVYFNGSYLPASAAKLSWADAGFVTGTTVAEQLRTFGGKLFHVEEHVDRLKRSLQILGIKLDPCERPLASTAQELAARNHQLLPQGYDLGLCIFVTPGPYPAMAPTEIRRPNVGMHTYPLPFGMWAQKYRTGQALASVSVVQPSGQSWPPELKVRSRVHFYLADREAAEKVPGARALLTDEAGHVTETSTANILLLRQGRLVSPPLERILHGISLKTTVELATAAGIAVEYGDLTLADVATADEVWLTSTPFALLPATSLDGQPIGDGNIGPVYQQMLARWNDLVGLDIAAQALSTITS